MPVMSARLVMRRVDAKVTTMTRVLFSAVLVATLSSSLAAAQVRDRPVRAGATAAMPPDTTAIATVLADAGPSAGPILMPMLKVAGSSTRGAAAASLGRLKAQEAEPILLQMMKEPEPFIRMSAAVALA